MELKLFIILLKPPLGVDFGLQKGSGNNYETMQIQRSGSHDLCFNLVVTVKGSRLTDALPGFSGPFVQGPPSGKFIYIDIGTLAGQTSSCWNRRLKIPLTGITWEIIDRMATDPSLFFETRVAGTGRDGGPNCATVKPFEGWSASS